MSTDAAEVAARTAADTITEVPDSQLDTGLVADDAVETPTEETATETATQATTPVIPDGYISVEEHQRRLEQSRHDAAQAREDKLLNELQPLIQEARGRAPQPVDPIAAELAEFAADLDAQVEDGILQVETRNALLRREYKNLQKQATYQQQATTYNQHMQQQYAAVLDKAYTDTLATEGIAPNTPELQMVQEMTKQHLSAMRPEALTPELVKATASMFATVAKQKVASLREVKPAGNTTIEPGAATATAPVRDHTASPPTETFGQMAERIKREAGLV